MTVLVWTRPRLSVGGTLWNLCPPGSSANAASAPLPEARKTISPGRLSTSSMTWSKTAAVGALHIAREQLVAEELRVLASLGRPDLDYD